MTSTQMMQPDKHFCMPITRRILLTISYDGNNYAGWQRQKNAIAIQQCVEEALFKITGERISVTGASRTDAGVHAKAQYAHFDTMSRIPPDKFPFALNGWLPRDIRVLEGKQVDGHFHARFDAKGKRYTYRIHNAFHASAMYHRFLAHVPTTLDIEAMVRSFQPVIGTHDFAAFQAAGGTAKTTVRTITRIELTQEEDIISIVVEGNAFLYNMIRIIAGTLIEIGQHRIAEDAFTQALLTGNRKVLGITAPAFGLELSDVFYD